MCTDVGILPDGTEIPCRKCWQCIETKIDDWVGRCVAENETATEAHSITLTYGRDENGEEDHLRAAWLTYSDVQKFFKLLRRHGYKFRYLVAGEYGSTKGRAHWHLLMFWQGKVPPHELSVYSAKRFSNQYWPHGYQHWEKPTPKSIRYVCKYICKDQGDEEKQGHLSMSKKPPLGNAYFRNLAFKYVRNGLAPQTLKYRFPHIKREDGTPKEFVMRGTTARNFIEDYKALWLRHQGGHHPYSEIIEAHDDKLASEYLPEWIETKELDADRDLAKAELLKITGVRDFKLSPPKMGLRTGTEPRIGKFPFHPYSEIYSDIYEVDEWVRYWYLPDPNNVGAYTWQNEKTIGVTGKQSSPQLQENQYDKAKRGRETK